MPYFQLRITLSDTRTKKVILRSIKYLIREYNMTLYSTGYEEFNKYGEPCDPHFHFNFVEDLERINPKRCIADKLKRYYENLDISLKGNKQWSLQMVEEPGDFDRWFRYPLKENPIIDLIKDGTSDLSGNFGPDPDELDSIIQRAKDERRTSIEINILRREKLRNKDQFKDKLFTYLDNIFTDALIDMGENPADYIPNEGQIYCEILTYYKQISKPMSFDTIGNYTNLYRLENGHLTNADAYNLWKKKSKY